MIEIKKADKLLKTALNIKDEAYVCTDKGETLGFVEYKYENKDIIITKIDCEENMLADGLVRQTMSNALDNGMEIAKFENGAQTRAFEIRIVKNKDQNSLDILEFFMKINHI